MAISEIQYYTRPQYDQYYPNNQYVQNQRKA